MASHPDLSGFPVVLELPVLWGDQDAFGHVNNTVYLRWCESARVEYLRRIDLWPPLPPSGIGPILASISCDYKRPVTYPDTVSIGASVTRIGNSSFRMEHRIVSRAFETPVAESVSTIVLLDYAAGRAVRVPDECRKAIAALERRSVEVPA